MAKKSEYLVEMKDIYKSYGKVLALKGVNFRVGNNEVVGLIGDNGAGKSTLIKILSGVLVPDEGEIYFNGQKLSFHDHCPTKMRKLGIETVYQEKAICDKQTVWRNIFIGRPITNKIGLIDIVKEKSETEKIMKEVIGFRGVGVSAESKVSILSGGERQGVAIGRAMYFDADLVVLDEPTVGLAYVEVLKVLNFIKTLKNNGKSCVIISHNIPDVYSAADNFAFLDDGKVVKLYEKSEISERELVDEFIKYCK